ncbi:Adenosyl-chloride synthase [bacterium HR40]|nr:Adenosyl-chloride synthase [bacterium HR40]
MILLFTDFGEEGPYVGEMEAVLARLAPEVPRVRLLSDAPAFDPRRSAYILAALAQRFLAGDVCLAVVDPGVGTERAALALRADGVWFVGPDNGLFELVLRRAGEAETFRIDWRPPQLSASFHGRDLFAPVAARLARGDLSALSPAVPSRFPLWPDDLPEVVWCDRYGNAWTGLRAAALPPDARLRVSGRELARARTFGDLPAGTAFWYENSAGLVEIAVNCGSAVEALALGPGSPVDL